MIFKKQTLLTMVVTLFSFTALANEPNFCNPQNFMKLEDKNISNDLIRARNFKVGELNLIGLAVGKSNLEKIKDMALSFSDFREDEKYCTFYLNKGELEKEKEFNHHYLSAPYLKVRHGKIKRQYTRALRPVFEDNATSFVSCAKDHKFIALGCNGQKHRGPTAFAMFLAYAGCNPNNAVNIANMIWGKNMVRFATRWKLAKMAYAWGEENPQNRQLLQSMMTKNSQ